jgi:hypothetical protein
MDSESDLLSAYCRNRTRSLVKVTGTIDGHPFKSSLMAMGDGRHMLPVKTEIRRAIGKGSRRNCEGAPETADTQLTKAAHSQIHLVRA